jgi:hypothetical protein
MLLQWLVDTLAPTARASLSSPYPHRRDGKRHGCVTVEVKASDINALLNLNQRIVFDNTGIFVARSPQEAAVMESCCSAERNVQDD